MIGYVVSLWILLTAFRAVMFDKFMVIYAIVGMQLWAFKEMFVGFWGNLFGLPVKETPQLIFDEKYRAIVEECPSFQKYEPCPYFMGGYAMSAAGFFFSGSTLLGYRRHWVVLRDGVEVALDELPPTLPNDNAPVLLCLHGIGGDSQDNYLRRFIPAASKAGWRCYVYVRRGHGNTSLRPTTSTSGFPEAAPTQPSSHAPGPTTGPSSLAAVTTDPSFAAATATDPSAMSCASADDPEPRGVTCGSPSPSMGRSPFSPGVTSSLSRHARPGAPAPKSWPPGGRPAPEPLIWHKYADVADMEEVVAAVRSRHPGVHVCAVGFSAGAITLTKYLGEVPGAGGLTAAVSVGNVFDVSLSSVLLQKYAPLMDTLLACSGQKVMFKTNMAELQRRMRGKLEVGRVLRSASLRDFDQHLTVPAFGYSSVDEYYASQSSMESLEDVDIPLLCLSAWSDPILHRSLLTRIHQLAANNPNVVMCTTQEGGHLGWLEGWTARNWMNNAILEYLTAITKTKPPGGLYPAMPSPHRDPHPNPSAAH